MYLIFLRLDQEFHNQKILLSFIYPDWNKLFKYFIAIIIAIILKSLMQWALHYLKIHIFDLIRMIFMI